MTPARFRWGMILVIVGVLLLLINADVIEIEALEQLVIWFPVLLIAIGVEKLFTRSKLEFISYLTTVFLAVSGIWLAVDAGANGSRDSFFESTTYREAVDPSATELSAVLDVGDAGVKIRDATRDLVYGRFAEGVRKPKTVYSLEDNGTARVKIGGEWQPGWGSIIKIDNDFVDDWSVKFNDQLPLDLEISGNHADLHFNLATTPLRSLRIDSDNSDIYLKIGDMVPDVDVEVLGDDTKLHLRVPREAKLRVESKEFVLPLEGVGLSELESGIFVSEGYDTSSQRIQVALDKKLRRLQLDRY